MYEYFLPQEDAEIDINYENENFNNNNNNSNINDGSVQMSTLTNMADFSVMVPDLNKESKIPIHEQRRRYEEYIKRRCCNMTMENYKKLSNVIKQFIEECVDQAEGNLMVLNENRNKDNLINIIDAKLLQPQIAQAQQEPALLAARNKADDSDDSEDSVESRRHDVPHFNGNGVDNGNGVGGANGSVTS